MQEPVVETFLGEKPSFRGKVRDIYSFSETLLIVATDRISAFDSVLPTPIPGRGIILTQLSVFWFRATSGIVPNHLIAWEVNDFPEKFKQYGKILNGRAMWVKKAERIDIECVVRGYLAGSAWDEYRRTGTICGIKLPSNLSISSRLPEFIFTPATKALSGAHDENITFYKLADIVGEDTAKKLRDISLEIYAFAHDYALERGIIIADTKLEFGWHDGKIIAIDEMISPDSSRFWDAEKYKPGIAQEALDKQFVRDWLIKKGWRGDGPPPELPQKIVEQTIQRYQWVAEKIMRV